MRFITSSGVSWQVNGYELASLKKIHGKEPGRKKVADGLEI